MAAPVGDAACSGVRRPSTGSRRAPIRAGWTCSALRTLLPWPEAARLDELAPTHIEVPSGSSIRLDYPDPDRIADGHRRPERTTNLRHTCRPESSPRGQTAGVLRVDGCPAHLRRPGAHHRAPALPCREAAGGDQRSRLVLGECLRPGPGREPGPLPEAPVARGPADRTGDEGHETLRTLNRTGARRRRLGQWCGDFRTP
jgi:hypothetical protein